MKPDNAFDARLAAKKLLREGRSGALATLMPGSSDPYCSLVNVATAIDGAPLLLLSKLTLHMKNILADQRVSLMIDERKEGDALEGARVMLMGNCAKTSGNSSVSSYLRRHPEAEAFASFADFAFYRIEIARAHLVAGFGRIVDLKPQDVLTDISDAGALVDSETDAIVHMNADHADACRLYATELLGASEGDWRCVGIDPEGLELQKGRTALRLSFPQRVTGPGPLRGLLKQLADRARAASGQRPNVCHLHAPTEVSLSPSTFE
jgi:putative heme iron utilization protein